MSKLRAQKNEMLLLKYGKKEIFWIVKRCRFYFFCQFRERLGGISEESNDLYHPNLSKTISQIKVFFSYIYKVFF